MPKASAATPHTPSAADSTRTRADELAPAAVPMYRRTQDPDAPRHVTAPGGYEWWHFDAVSGDARTRIVARFGFGPQSDANWLRRYRRYRRRPTRHAPPIPSDEAYVELHILHEGRQASLRAAGAAEIETTPLHLRIGMARFQRTDDGRLRIDIPVRNGMGATLNFRPPAAAIAQERAMPPGRDGARHFWLPSPARDTVEGLVHMANVGLPFTGQGWREHSFGTGPIRPAFSWWLTGRLLEERGVLAFRWARPRDGTADSACLVAGAGLETSATAPAVRVEASHTPPATINLGASLRLESPQVLASGPGRSLVVYRGSGTRSGEALCDLLSPARLALRLPWRS